MSGMKWQQGCHDDRLLLRARGLEPNRNRMQKACNQTATESKRLETKLQPRARCLKPNRNRMQEG
eukprot:344004-Chlamydomonas_euryale.AAC.1